MENTGLMRDGREREREGGTDAITPAPSTRDPNDDNTSTNEKSSTNTTETPSKNTSSISFQKSPDVEIADLSTPPPEPEDGIDWRPGFRQQFPWIGMSGLFIMLLATSMGITILCTSHQKRVKDWPFTRFPIQPNVLINIANQFQNLGLITFISQGLAIAWWRKAMRGSKLRTLHRNHAYSYSFYSIVTSGRHFNIVALAALMTKFAVIDSTLFQKATKTIVTQQVNYTNASVTAWVETQWPEGSGGVPGEDGEVKMVDTAWAGVIAAYNGKIANGKCSIRPAVVEYPVTVMVPSKEELNGKNIVTHIKFYSDNTTHPLSTPIEDPQIDALKFLSHVDLDERFNETSTIGALTYVLNTLYSSSANLTYRDDWDIALRGSQAQSTFFADSDTQSASRCWYAVQRPGLDDPAIELLRKLNTISFVAALYLKGQSATAAPDRAAAGMANQTVVTAVTGIVEEYTTDFKYVAGALVATLVTILLVLPVYWGFWHLGRKVTLGPLEIANAFNAPVIRPETVKAQHGDFEQVLQEVGERRV
ncbi:hypothetical protein N0V94_008671, partial [Neodidymelliopsis sp. IMI 364377]